MPALTKKKLTLIGLDPATSGAPQVNKAAFIYIFVIPFFSRGGEGCCVDPTTTDAEMSTYSSVIHISLLYLSIQYQTMNDHLAALNAPPPRYLLESDSSDEEGQGAYPGSSTPKPKISIDTPPVEVSVIRGTGNEEVRDLVLALGQAGKYLKKHLGVSGSAVGQEEVGKVVVGGRQAGQGWKVGEGLVFSVNEANLPHEAVWEIAQKLLANVKAQSWYVQHSHCLGVIWIPVLTYRLR